MIFEDKNRRDFLKTGTAALAATAVLMERIQLRRHHRSQRPSTRRL